MANGRTAHTATTSDAPGIAPPSATVPVAVVGTGPAGLATALALARQGLDVALVGPDPKARSDNRTAALFGGSVELLRNLGVLEACRSESAPIAGIRLIDDTGRLVRAPETVFEAREAGRDLLGYNFPNARLTHALASAVAATPTIRSFIGRSVARVVCEHDAVRLQLDDGTELKARLVAAADGRGSVCRAGAGIATRAWGYPQTAITTSFSHAKDHAGISTELHRPAGPLTTVPLKGRASSLVWVETPGEAARLMALDDATFLAELSRRLGGLLGTLSGLAPRAAYPLSGLGVERMAARRVALVGEAGHVFPPIGAQGLNLGLRDAAYLAQFAAEAQEAGRDIGGGECLAAYDRARQPDVMSRTAAVDLLNRALITDLLPVQVLRGLGVHALRSIGPLKRFLMREGLTPSFAEPALMRPGSTRTGPASTGLTPTGPTTDGPAAAA